MLDSGSLFIERVMHDLAVFDDIRAEERQWEAGFHREGSVYLPALIGASTAGLLSDIVMERAAAGMAHRGDALVPHAAAEYASPPTEFLLSRLRDSIERLLRVELYPTYSYTRIFRRGDALPPHRDRPSCEVSVLLCLRQSPDGRWPFYVEGSEGVRRMRPDMGGAVIYGGADHTHWRNGLRGEYSIQVTLHYVRRDGPHRELRFDERASLFTQRG
jgi:hypothetical protein